VFGRVQGGIEVFQDVQAAEEDERETVTNGYAFGDGDVHSGSKVRTIGRL